MVTQNCSYCFSLAFCLFNHDKRRVLSIVIKNILRMKVIVLTLKCVFSLGTMPFNLNLTLWKTPDFIVLIC